MTNEVNPEKAKRTEIVDKHLPPSVLFTCYLPDQHLEQALIAISKQRPRLFLPPERERRVKQHIRSDAMLGAFFETMRAQADAMLDLEPVEHQLEGRRLLDVSRQCLKRVVYLSLARRMTGEPQYGARAEEEMVAAAAFEDWNPSHFLDTAEMTTALAIGYDWLYHDLAQDAREKIRNAIIEKGLQASIGGNPRHMEWISGDSNWTQVCHASMVIGALAVGEDVPELAAQIITRALDNIGRPMAAYDPQGAYPEGPIYWGYGTNFNVLLLDALQSALGSLDMYIDITQHEGFMRTGDYMLHVTAATGDYFNYFDNSPDAELQSAQHWFALRFKNPGLLWHEKRLLERYVHADHDAADHHNRLDPFALIWAQPIDDLDPPKTLHWDSGGVNPIGTHRSAWTRDAVYLGIKGGRPRTAHGHMDIGSFVMESDGVRWAVDLGAQRYHALEAAGLSLWDLSQEGDRWEIFRLNNRSHNTLVVNDELQRVEGMAPIIHSSSNEQWAYTIINMTEVYEGQLVKAHRGGAMLHNYQIVIQDELTATDEAAHVRWGMVTQADVEITDAQHAILKQNGQTLGFDVLRPAEAEIQIYSMEPPAAYDVCNSGTRMIGFEATLAPNSEQRLVVLLTPGQTTPSKIAIKPLSKW
ncbi:heparinase II/III family protein [Phycisphaerales bacterium AB-hyl4]|uniref:Heparinase II/III family protein n=1 Tax=Natronomicrosphaera hydrolytica TaxID=3242702 RepID=A0ABV4U6G7_9BACT